MCSVITATQRQQQAFVALPGEERVLATCEGTHGGGDVGEVGAERPHDEARVAPFAPELR